MSDALDKLQSEGIIEPVAHSRFATPIVPVMKPTGEVRICGDYRSTANPAIQLDSYPLPKPDDMFSSLAGCRVYSKLDLSQAYAQLLLDEESKEVTTIKTPKGLFRYN